MNTHSAEANIPSRGVGELCSNATVSEFHITDCSFVTGDQGEPDDFSGVVLDVGGGMPREGR